MGQAACHLAALMPGQPPALSAHPRAEIAQHIRRALPEGGIVVVELTGGLEIPLLQDLETDARYQLQIAQHTDSLALRRLLRIPRKTDRLDAELIARLAALSLGPETAALVGDHLRPWPDMRAAILTRPALRHLEALVRDRQRAKLRLGRRSDPFQREQLSALIAALAPLIAAAEAELVARAGPDEAILDTLPGVTPRRAAIIAATIGSAARFPTPHHLVRYVGLRPPLPSISGGKNITRPKIAKASTLLAGELHLWALQVARFPERHHRFGVAYLRYKERDRKRDGMWTAKRLLIRTAWRLLIDRVEFDPER